MNGPDLFDALAAQDATDEVHQTLPSMITACGRDLLDIYGIEDVTGRSLHTLTVEDVTCRQCLATGEKHGGLAALIYAISRNQAPVEE